MFRLIFPILIVARLVGSLFALEQVPQLRFGTLKVEGTTFIFESNFEREEFDCSARAWLLSSGIARPEGHSTPPGMKFVGFKGNDDGNYYFRNQMPHEFGKTLAAERPKLRGVGELYETVGGQVIMIPRNKNAEVLRIDLKLNGDSQILWCDANALGTPMLMPKDTKRVQYGGKIRSFSARIGTLEVKGANYIFEANGKREVLKPTEPLSGFLPENRLPGAYELPSGLREIGIRTEKGEVITYGDYGVQTKSEFARKWIRDSAYHDGLKALVFESLEGKRVEILTKGKTPVFRLDLVTDGCVQTFWSTDIPKRNGKQKK